MNEQQINTQHSWPVGYLFLAWLASICGVLGSLYFSEVANFIPCVLCWWQRIFMYPLAILLPIGIAKRDKNIHLYTLPLAIIGLLIGIYQNLLYYHILPERIAPCANGVSCLAVNVQIFGFLDIPLMALGTFVFIVAVLVLYAIKIKKSSNV